MTSALLIERASAEFESVGDGWTVYGRAVPFDTRQRVTDDGKTYYEEEFDPAAFNRDVSYGGRWVNLMVGHAGYYGARFLGHTQRLEALDDGLYATVRLNREHPQAEAARAGELRGWSISAKVFKTRQTRGGVRRRMLCGLEHIAATPVPQYEGAGVLVARDNHVIETITTPRLDRWRGLLAP